MTGRWVDLASVLVTTPIRTYPGARQPDRTRRVDADGVGIAVHEWGRENDPVIYLVHGGSDFARTLDVFAPLIADAGWRAVAWDHRGHGDSDHAALYSWDADIRDAIAVMESTTSRPSPVIAHSKGGALMMQLAEAGSWRVSHFVNIDGMPSKRRMPDVPDHDQSRLLAGEIGSWLDHRHTAHEAIRKPGTLEDLARRRGKMNPRLSIEWLEYLVTVGATQSEDGWRWKLDPAMRFGGFGPWRPEWSALRMASLTMPFLGFLGTEDEPMGWGARARDITPWLPRAGRLEVLEGIGHFIHIEEPARVASTILEFLS